ncbi:hypothetical protein MHU86_1035 [Fragilaria crotonensis]|nr:hypothetical protein MHU86_1035 [Fragilaria crotonensis]
MSRKNAILLVSITLGFGIVPEASSSSSWINDKIRRPAAPSCRVNTNVQHQYNHNGQSHLKSMVAIPRGGASMVETKSTETTNKKRKKKKKPKTPADLMKEKEAIKDALKEKDSAKALGDAIRDRTDDWLETDPLFNRLDASVTSVGWAMGTSDDGGSVEAAPSSVVAHYLLKSHGGAHALQSICSLFAVLLSVGACLAPSTNTKWQIIFLKRAMLCAMTKHLAGLLAATGMTATAIPKVGLGQARRWMEQLARDPVSQYVFYAALMLVWLSSTPVTATRWFSNVPVVGKYIPLVLVGPILLREAISVTFVVSDILLLLHQTASTSDYHPAAALWKTGHALANAVLSLLVTPTLWRTSTAAQRQAILARLTAKASLLMELLTGLLIVADALYGIWEFTMTPHAPKPRLVTVAQRILCARLYVNFLWVRRTKIRQLGQQVRGGAAQVPVRILDALYDPCGAMGIEKPSRAPQRRMEEWNWKDYVVIGLGLDEDK